MIIITKITKIINNLHIEKVISDNEFYFFPVVTELASYLHIELWHLVSFILHVTWLSILRYLMIQFINKL